MSKLEWKRGVPTEEEFANNWVLNAGSLSRPRHGVLLIPPGGERGTWWPNTWYLLLDVEEIELTC